MLEWYAAQGALGNLVTELTTAADYGKFIGFPFKVLGLGALLILFLLAATSHDFWLLFLTPPVWKALHMALYGAYGLVVMHVALGDHAVRAQCGVSGAVRGRIPGGRDVCT